MSEDPVSHCRHSEERQGTATCAALDRAEAKGCAFYEPGRDGYCAHTIRRLESEEYTYLAGRRISKKRTLLESHVTGDCHCEQAYQDMLRRSVKP